MTTLIYLWKKSENTVSQNKTPAKKSVSKSETKKEAPSNTNIKSEQTPEAIPVPEEKQIEKNETNLRDHITAKNTMDSTTDKPDIIPITKQQWKHINKTKALAEEYTQLKQEILRTPKIKIRYFPFISISSQDENLRVLSFPFAVLNENLEKIYSYWKMGYQDSEISSILLFYYTFIYTHYNREYLKILELLTCKNLSRPLKDYYHMLLPLIKNQTDSKFSQITNNNIYDIPEIQDHSTEPIISFYTKLFNSNRNLTIKNYKRFNQFTLKYFPHIKLNQYLSEIIGALQYRSDIRIKIYIYKNLKLNLFSTDLILKQILFYGSYKRISMLKINNRTRKRYLNYINNKEGMNQTISNSIFRRFKNELPWYNLHIFYIFYKNNNITQMPEDILESLKKEYSTLSKTEFNEKTINMPPAIKKALIAFLSYSKAYRMLLWTNALQSEYLKSDTAVIISLSRSMFYLKKTSIAIGFLKSHLKNQKNNIIVLNELAIYYYYEGDLEKSDDIFNYLKENFSENISINYNYNLYSDRKHAIKSFLEWKNLREKINNIR